MPKIKNVRLPSSVEVDVPIYEYLMQCTKEEKASMFKLLVDSGYGASYSVRGPKKSKRPSTKTIPHQEFADACYALARNYHRLSNTEEEEIKRLASKFI